MDGMIIAMSIGAMSSVSLGMNIDTYLASGLTISTIAAILIGMIAGYLTGKFVSLMASIEGVMAGIMGGLMSPMLAAMLSNPMPLIWFFDIVYLLVIVMIIALVKEARQAFLEERSKSEGNKSNESCEF
ncbi:hypothetical protein NDK47_13835 [Brevibacillus ruminantium]|uniref:Uncharacterized protein n=1 Tax=Brevibacillus ruminantium TaxID=2950604 RepID=A0ABY4WN54_9BACL|nr:hypothetical protein [Brevibacillus ruminantium]USG68289.1 hypothetical protein NDK47_13835 [Brevibacillus ruminantium]